MRASVRIVALAFCGLLVGPLGLSAAERTGPLVLHLTWRSVSRDAVYVTAGARYAAILDSQSKLTLIDEQTHRRARLSVPNCGAPNEEGYPMIDGGWLAFSCGTRTYELYDLASGRWTSFVDSPQCGYDPRLGQGACRAVAIGRYWVKLETTDGPCMEHCGALYDLQNIQTGAFRPDPVTPGGRGFDDLSAPSGSATLCRPLRYPASYNSDIKRWEPGSLRFYGPFALTMGDVPAGGSPPSYQVERCGARLKLAIHTARRELQSYPFARVLASDRAVMWTSGSGALVGRFLPSLKPFTIRLPVTLRHAIPAALSQRTVYLSTPGGGRVWAAPLPH